MYYNGEQKEGNHDRKTAGIQQEVGREKQSEKKKAFVSLDISHVHT